MNVKQRVLAARLAEKGRKNREYLKELGIDIFYEDHTDIKGDRNDEKECNYRNLETVRCSHVKGNYIY